MLSSRLSRAKYPQLRQDFTPCYFSVRNTTLDSIVEQSKMKLHYWLDSIGKLSDSEDIHIAL